MKCRQYGEMGPNPLLPRTGRQRRASAVFVSDRHNTLCLNADDELELMNRGTDMPNTAPVVHSDPDILGGTPVFVGTRVPFRNLIDYLERNHSLDEFLDSFPSVSREQAVASLEAAHEAVSDLAHSA